MAATWRQSFPGASGHEGSKVECLVLFLEFPHCNSTAVYPQITLVVKAPVFGFGDFVHRGLLLMFLSVM